MRVAVQNTNETFRRELATLFEKLHRVLYRAAYNITKQVEDAEDVLQSVFSKLIVKPRSKEFFQNPDGYLYRTVVNEALNVVRSHRRRKKADQDVYRLEIPATADEPHRDDMIERLQAAMKEMSELNPERAELLRLHYYEAYSYAQIAKHLQRSPAAIAMEMVRARAELKQLILSQGAPNETKKDKHQRSRKPILANASEI
jgi:RNA polymerase sigma-70 factor (ECF subfamily)